MSQETMYQEVVNICRADPRAANDRAMLLERVYYNHGWLDDRSLYDNLCRMPRPEGVMRRLRDAIAKGDVVVSKDERKRLDHAAHNEIDRYSDFNTRLINNYMKEK